MMKPLFFAIATAAALTGCMTYEPVTQDKQGRAVVSGAEAAQMFVDYCYKSPNGAAAKRSGAFTAEDVTLENAYSGKHKSKAADITSLRASSSAGSCIISFVGSNTAVDSATAAAVRLTSLVDVKNVGGKKGGGSINFVTSKGTVVVGNSSKRHPQGFSIMILNAK